MALFNCAGQMVAQNNNGCGSMPELTADLKVVNQPYYLLVDGNSSSDKGAFGIGMSYQ
jgi:hypothetical protein